MNASSPQQTATPRHLQALELMPLDFTSAGQLPLEAQGLRREIRECHEAHWIGYRRSSWSHERARIIGLELTDAGYAVLARGGTS